MACQQLIIKSEVHQVDSAVALQALDAVIRERGFERAAQKLCITQSAVSQRKMPAVGGAECAADEQSHRPLPGWC
jgi:hypothetical protein